MIKTFFYKAINFIFFIAFAWIFVNVIFKDKGWFIKYNPLVIIILAVLFVGLIFLINKKFEKWFLNITKTRKLLLLSAVIITMMVIQVFLGYYLRVTPSWDFGSVQESAVDLAKYGKIVNMDYFLNFRNNTGSLLLISLVYKIFYMVGIDKFGVIGILFNIMMIDASIVLMFFACDKLFGTAKAFLALFIAAMMTPLYTYAPIYYTDTLSMMFPVLILYLLILSKDVEVKWKKYALYFLIGSLGFIGGQIKLTVTFMLIAIAIELILKDEIKSYTPKIATMVLAFLITLKIFNALVDVSGVFNFKMSEKSPTPFTHWLMMGLKNHGGWNGEDYELTYSYPTREERIEVNLQEIKNRLKDYKVGGYFKFATAKAEWTWGDGTYFAPEKLRRKPLDENVLHQVFLEKGKYFKYYAYFSQAIHVSVLIFILASSFGNIITKRNDYTNILRIVMFGIMIFLIMWEARPRYIVNYIPVFILVAVEGVNILDNYLKKKISR